VSNLLSILILLAVFFPLAYGVWMSSGGWAFLTLHDEPATPVQPASRWDWEEPWDQWP
jgi:hypothetical protein